MNGYLMLLLIVCGNITANTKRCYYNSQFKIAPSGHASYYAVFKQDAESYDATVYTMAEDVLVTQGHYNAIPDDLNAARAGEFTYYHKNGNKAATGMYDHNMREGRWQNFFYSTTTLRSEQYYSHDSLDGACVNYYPAGTRQNEGQYINGKQEGEWKYYHKEGGLSGEETYTAGKVVQRKYYDGSQRLTKLLVYEQERLVSARSYNNAGAEIPYIPVRADSAIYKYVEQMPAPDFDMSRYLGATLKYPPKAKKHNIEGRVIVKFMVDEEGNIGSASIVQSVSPELDAEALRVVQLMPKWRPGKQNGDPVQVWYSLPLLFKLTP